MMPKRSRHLLAWVLVCVLSAPAASWAQKHSDWENIGNRDITKGSWNFYSIEKEIRLGRTLAAHVEATSHVFRDRFVRFYLDDLVQRLARNSDARLPFIVRVIDSGELNAFALPGGYLFVNTGLILEAQTEAELAGILAHEIAHVTARHGTKQATKSTIFQWATLPLLFLGGPAGYGIQQGLGLAVPMTLLKFQRNAEREADFLGLQYTYRAGYDPVALIDFLERLNDTEGRLAKLFSTHPMNTDRIQRAQKAIAAVLPPREDYVVSTSRFDQVQRYLERLQRVSAIYRFSAEGEPQLRRRSGETGKEDEE